MSKIIFFVSVNFLVCIVYIYTPLLTKNELEKKIIHGVIAELLRRYEQSTISYLAEGLSDNEEDIEKIKQKLDEMKKDV